MMKRVTILLAACLLAGAAQGQMFARLFGSRDDAWTPLDLGPVVWYKGESDATDAMGSADGTWSSSAAYADCEVGKGFDFSGANMVSTTLPVSSTGLTFSCWISGEIIGADTFKRFVCARNGNFWMQLLSAGYLDDNVVQLGVTTSGGAIAAGWQSAVIDTTYPRHVVGTWDGSAACLYVDGVSQSGAYEGGMGGGDDGVLSIGARSSIGDTCYDGVIDDVLIFGRALTEAEITVLYVATTNQAGKAW